MIWLSPIVIIVRIDDCPVSDRGVDAAFACTNRAIMIFGGQRLTP